MYSETHFIKFSHTDAAGLIYFGKLYELGHEVLENYLNQTEYSVAKMLKEREYITPIAHSEADYLAPMRLGDKVTIEIGIEHIGTSSFTTYYLFFSASTSNGETKKQLLAQAKTVNVCVSKKTGKKMELPYDFKQFLMNNKEKSKKIITPCTNK